MTSIYDTQPAPLVIPLSLDGTECLVFDVGGPEREPTSGWAAFYSTEVEAAGLSVVLRFGALPDQPLEIREFRVVALSTEISFNSPLMRAIPFTRIVAAVNRPALLSEIRPLLARPNLIWEGRLPGSGYEVWTIPPRVRARMPRPKLRLPHDAGRKRPDAFYEKLAEVYLAQASISNRPAQDVAMANEIPVSTVHRWLKEARARGILRLPRLGEASKGPGGQ